MSRSPLFDDLGWGIDQVVADGRILERDGGRWATGTTLACMERSSARTSDYRVPVKGSLEDLKEYIIPLFDA